MIRIVVVAGALALAACTTNASRTEVAEVSTPPGAFASDRIEVTVRGTGPDVVLIPGLSSSPGRAWDSTVAAVPGYRYHLVQVKGFAGVPVGANATGPVAAPVAAEIARYIGERGLKRPAVVGHSMGGTIGLMLAARHPDAVGRLMVVDMLPFLGAMFGPPGATPDSVRPIAEQIRTAMNGPASAAGEQMLTTMINGMVRTETARAPILADSRNSDRGATANSYYELVTTDLTPELSRIAVPVRVLYVTPAGAPLTDAQIDAIYKGAYARVPGATLARVPDAAHFLQIDNPAFFQSELKSFLNR